MKAKFVFENIKSVLVPKDLGPKDHLVWKFQNDLKIPIIYARSNIADGRKRNWLRTSNFIIHYSRQKEVKNWIEKNTPFLVGGFVNSTQDGGSTLIDLIPKTNEGISNILKPKSSEEISKGLDFVKDLDDLYYGHEYIILDRGMNRWMNALTYLGLKDGQHTFGSSFMNDDFTLEYTPKEMQDAIEDNEIALDNTSINPDII